MEGGLEMTVTAFNLPETVSVSFLVIAGQFGNGEDRKQRLKKAGYNAEEVQKCINDFLNNFHVILT